MIVELLLKPIFLLVKGLLSFIPEIETIPSFLTDTIKLLRFPLSIFPGDLWKIIIGNLLFWIAVHIAWAIIEWVYKKIPGVS